MKAYFVPSLFETNHNHRKFIIYRKLSFSNMSAPIENTFIREIELKYGEHLKIHQLEIGDVGCVVWDAALVMCKYLETADFDGGTFWQGLDVVEVGAGTGCLGVCAAVYGFVSIIQQYIALFFNLSG